MSTSIKRAALAPYSHELAWPEGLEPYRIIDETGTQGDPYEHYAWMRRHAPILRCAGPDGSDSWVISRHADVRWGLRKPKLFRSQVNDEQHEAFLTLIDAPDHTRLRKVVAAAFIPKAIALVEDRIREVATERLDEMLAVGGGEVYQDFARPLTMSTICKLLDVPLGDLDKVNVLAEALLVYFARLGRNAPGDPPRDEQLTNEFMEYLRENLLRLHRDRSESVGGHISRAWLDEGVLSQKEATELSAFLFIAGFETTSRLLCGAFLELNDRPARLARLRDEPDAPARFVEEVARMRGPIHRAVRRTTQDVEIGGVTIPEGDVVRFLLASANRDETVWPNGDEFDMDRDHAEGHFAFGYGIHSCLGAPLARLEARVMVELLGRKVGAVKFDPGQDLVLLKGNSISSGPDTLRVELRPLS